MYEVGRAEAANRSRRPARWELDTGPLGINRQAATTLWVLQSGPAGRRGFRQGSPSGVLAVGCKAANNTTCRFVPSLRIGTGDIEGPEYSLKDRTVQIQVEMSSSPPGLAHNATKKPQMSDKRQEMG